MNKNISEQDRLHEVCLRADKVASFSQEDLRKIVPEVQFLLRRLVQHVGELEATQKQSADLYDYAPVGYFTLDNRGVITNVNITARDMFNIPATKLINTPFASLVGPDYREAFSRYLREIADTGQRLSTEVELCRTDSTTFYAQLQTVALYEKSNITYRVSVADITERKRIERALSESEEHYRNLFESSLDGIVFTDLEGYIRSANPAYQKMLGYTIGELRNTTYQQLTPPRWHKMEATIVRDQILAKGYADVYEKEYVRKDGTVFPIAIRVWLIRDKGGEPSGMWGIVRDITERKKMEAELAHVVTIPELNPNPIVELDTAGNVRYANPAAKAIFPDMAQVGSAHSFTQNWQDLLNKLRGEKVTSLTREVESGASWYVQTVAYVPVSQTLRFYGRDITERKLADMTLKESEQKYRELTGSLAEGVFETDLQGTVTYANQRALDSHGLTDNDLRKGLNIFEYITPEYVDFARERFARVLQGENIGSEEYVLRRRDGATYPALVHGIAIMQDGKARGIRGIVVDITEQKRAEQALRESEKRFRTTLDSILEGCIILDFNWRYFYANDAAVRMGRRTKEERIGHTLMEVFPGIEQQDTFAHLKRCMENRTPERYETEFTFPEGIKEWFEVWAEPVPEGLAIFYMNIDERKRAEQRLQRELERLQHIYGITKLAEMQPVALLMIEHRLIERVIALLAEEKAWMEQTDTLAEEFIEYTVDFFRTYADKTHHGKEENVLFKALAGKLLAPEHRQIMDELIQEHELARKLVTELVDAKKRWESGDADAHRQLIAIVAELVKLYPKHIETEDKRFFLPSMSYLSAQEQDTMLLEFAEFDRQLIHQKYAQGVVALRSHIDQEHRSP